MIAFVALCVHAGIAASDVTCCKELGHYVQGDDHQQAIAELSKITPGGRQLGKGLRVLLAMKAMAGLRCAPDRRRGAQTGLAAGRDLVEAARAR